MVPSLGVGSEIAEALSSVLPAPWAGIGTGLLLFAAASSLHFRRHWAKTLAAVQHERRRQEAAARLLREASADGTRWLRVIQENLELVAEGNSVPRRPSFTSEALGRTPTSWSTPSNESRVFDANWDPDGRRCSLRTPSNDRNDSSNDPRMSTGNRFIAVVAAVILRDGELLLCQRPDGPHLPLLWEFPGGKVGPGEDPTAALARELAEELGVASRVGPQLSEVRHRYPEKRVWIRFYAAAITGSPQPRVHRQLRWIPTAELGRYTVPPANVSMVERIRGGGVTIPEVSAAAGVTGGRDGRRS